MDFYTGKVLENYIEEFQEFMMFIEQTFNSPIQVYKVVETNYNAIDEIESKNDFIEQEILLEGMFTLYSNHKIHFVIQPLGTMNGLFVIECNEININKLTEINLENRFFFPLEEDIYSKFYMEEKY